MKDSDRPFEASEFVGLPVRHNDAILGKVIEAEWKGDELIVTMDMDVHYYFEDRIEAMKVKEQERKRRNSNDRLS